MPRSCHRDSAGRDIGIAVTGQGGQLAPPLAPSTHGCSLRRCGPATPLPLRDVDRALGRAGLQASGRTASREIRPASGPGRNSLNPIHSSEQIGMRTGPQQDQLRFVFPPNKKPVRRNVALAAVLPVASETMRPVTRREPLAVSELFNERPQALLVKPPLDRQLDILLEAARGQNPLHRVFRRTPSSAIQRPATPATHLFRHRAEPCAWRHWECARKKAGRD